MGCTSSAPSMVEEMGVDAKCDGFHSEVKVRDSTATLIAAEPPTEEDLQTEPNPMQYLIGSLLGCDQEQAAQICEERQWVWGKAEWDVDFLVNLDGYAGGKKGMKASDVFANVNSRLSLDTDLTQEQIDELLDLVKDRCPLRRLLSAAGITVNDTWVKKGKSQKDLPAGKSDGEMVEEMGVTATANEPFFTEMKIKGSHGAEITTAEGKEDANGVAKYSNPMQLLICSLTTCDHEQGTQIATEEKKFDKWGPAEYATSFSVNLAGYMGSAKAALPARSVFPTVSIEAKIKTSASDAEVEEIHQLVIARCPLRRLFIDAGINIKSTWKKV
eukprot:GFYU01004030.1.p2 GENE.GFYU01004030.1~~GFYU01004030.1.p2  ORF type:complete len:329 (-),score=122.98 GFYU01004030.1:1629-2615(-)